MDLEILKGLHIEADDNCGNCMHFPTFWERFRETLLPILIYIGIVVVISFLITLGFYFVYKQKKNEHPWKHAFKKSWPWWIVVLLLWPFVLTLSYLLTFLT